MQRKMRAWSLSSLATNTAGQLDVLGHNGDTLGMDGAQVGVLKQTNKVGLGRLLKSHDGRGLESQVSLEVLGNFTDQTLEGELSDQQLSALLVTTDLTKGNGTGPVPMWLLYTTCSRSTLTSCLGGELFSWGLASGRFTGGLLCTCHFDSEK